MRNRFVWKLGLIILLLGISFLALGAKGCGWSQEEDIDNNNDLISGSSSDKQAVNILDPNHALAKTSWPMFLGNTQHTGCTPFIGPVTNTQKWTYTIGNALYSDVAIGIERTIYVGNHVDNKFYAFNPNGTLKWTYPSGSSTAPAIGVDGTIYFGSSKENKIYALQVDGMLKWVYPVVDSTMMSMSSPTIGPDETIYIGCKNILYALNSNGTLKWSYNLGGNIYRSSPAIGLDGTIYIGGGDSKFWAFNPNGTLKWIYKMTPAYDFVHSPAIGNDGTIYIANENGYLYAFNPGGTIKWLRSTNGPQQSSPAIGPDGTIYIGGWGTALYAVNPDGSLKWGCYYIHGMIGSALAIDANGIIYFGCQDDNIYALNPNGTLKWSCSTGNDIHSSPAIGADETLYITSTDGKFYAIGNPNKFIKASEVTVIDTSKDRTQPECEVSVPAGAVTTDTEVSVGTFDQVEDLPAPLPEGHTFLGGANLRPIHPGKVDFTSGKEADSYVILPSSVKAEELSTADIKLMEFIDGQWVIVLPNKKGKIITTGPKAGYIGPDDSAPAKLTGVRPWCWVVVPPPADTWIATSTTYALSARMCHTAIWTGREMIIWGGNNMETTGGIYNPATDSWAPTSLSNVPSGRLGHTAVWTGSKMIVWGGVIRGSYPTFLNTGGVYDPATDSWTPTSLTNAPSRRYLHTAIWTGSKMIVWGGHRYGGDGHLNTGGIYDPATDTWTPTSLTNAPSRRRWHTAVWTGKKMIVWGGWGYDASGYVTTGYINTGGIYDPATDTWTPITLTNASSGRILHTAVWTGSRMIIWGGQYYDGSYHYLNTGGIYDPGTDTWAETTAMNAPEGRWYHTAVWTGNKMIVWGGINDKSYLNTGGIYDPMSNAWKADSLTNTPPRVYHSAVWTDLTMIIWGGYYNDGAYHILNTGWKYTPPE